MDWPEAVSKPVSGKHAVKWALRTESEAYLDGLEARLVKAKAPNLLPRSTPSSSAAAFGLQDDPSELDFGDDEEDDTSTDQDELGNGLGEDDQLTDASGGRSMGGAHHPAGSSSDEGPPFVNEDDPGLALLWDQPPPPPPPTLPPTLSTPSTTTANPPTPSPPPLPLTVPSPSGRTRRISFNDQESLQPPTTTPSTSYTSTHFTTSTDSSPSSSYARPNRYLHSSHRERESSSHSRSSFATISESPPNSPSPSSSGSGTITPTHSSSQVLLPLPVPVPPRQQRTVRFNPRTLLRPSSLSSFASDRSGELISSSPMRGFMAWRLGGGPKPVSAAARSPFPNNASGASSSAWSAKRPPPTSVQAWANYYGTFSDADGGVADIRGNPLGAEPYEGWRPSVPNEVRVRKSEEEVMFGPGMWDRMSKWEWWIWKAGLADWWEGEPGGPGICCLGGSGWDEDDWGEHSGRDVRRVAGEGRGFF